jgi:hypothetical protein
MTKLVTVGADPELFIKDTSTNEFISAHDIIPGSKDVPCQVPKGAVQHDGVAAEFNINPAKTRKEFLLNIRSVKSILERICKNTNPNLVLVAEPTATFTKDYFASLPGDVLLLGCEPDFDAYTLEKNKKPETSEPFRTGSGHIHVGWGDNVEDKFSESHMQDCASLVKELDFAFTRAEKVWDGDTKRRSLYGNPGCFRPKNYGVEYRTLSNKWLDHVWTQMFVFDTTVAITNLWLKDVSIVETWNAMENKPNSYAGFCSFLESNKIPSTMSYNNFSK